MPCQNSFDISGMNIDAADLKGLIAAAIGPESSIGAPSQMVLWQVRRRLPVGARAKQGFAVRGSAPEREEAEFRRRRLPPANSRRFGGTVDFDEPRQADFAQRGVEMNRQ